MAGAGEIDASDTVRAAIGALVSGEKIERVEIKGNTEPVTVWRLAALHAGGAAPSRTPCIGWRAEIALFQGALDACRAVGQGQSVMLRGEAGIGMTRLVEEFGAMAERVDFAVHAGQAFDFGTHAGADAIGMILLSILDTSAEASAEERREKADAAIREGWLDEEDRMFLYDLLDLPLPEALRGAFDAMDNDLRIAGRRRSVGEMLRAASGARPCMSMRTAAISSTSESPAPKAIRSSSSSFFLWRRRAPARPCRARSKASCRRVWMDSKARRAPHC